MRWIPLAWAAFVAMAGGSRAQEFAREGGGTEAPPAVTKQRWITVSRETTRITEPLDEQGFVDYVAWANARGEGIAAEDNILVGIWEALGYRDFGGRTDRAVVEAYFAALGISVPERPDVPPLDFAEWIESEVDIDEESDLDIIYDAGERPWTDEEFPLVALFLDAHEATLSLALEALGRESWFAPLISRDAATPSLMTVSCPEQWPLTLVTQALTARACREAGRGRSGAALREIGVARAGFRRISGGTFVGFLKGRAYDGVLARTQAIVAVRGDASAEELEAALGSVDALPPPSDVARFLDEQERLACLDAIATLVRDPSVFASVLRLPPLPGVVTRVGLRVGFDWDAILERFNLDVDGFVAAAREETIAERLAARAAINARQGEWSRRYSTPLQKVAAMVTRESRTEFMVAAFERFVAPAIALVLEIEDTRRVELNLCRLSVSIALHRARHGMLPARLEDLVPGELDVLPSDPFREGEPFRYRLKGDAFELASTGPDGEWFVPGVDDWPDDTGDDIVLDLSTPEPDGGCWDEEADDFAEAAEADDADEVVVPPKALGVGTRE